MPLLNVRTAPAQITLTQSSSFCACLPALCPLPAHREPHLFWQVSPSASSQPPAAPADEASSQLGSGDEDPPPLPPGEAEDEPPPGTSTPLQDPVPEAASLSRPSDPLGSGAHADVSGQGSVAAEYLAAALTPEAEPPAPTDKRREYAAQPVRSYTPPSAEAPSAAHPAPAQVRALRRHQVLSAHARRHARS